MNLEQFRTVLDIGKGGDGHIVLPVADQNSERVFGGQILAQLVACAAPGKSVKSVQVAFPREGRPTDPLYLDLEKTHDGRSLGVRHACVFQEPALGGRRIVATGSILLDRADEEFDYQFDAVPTADPMTAKPIDFAVVPGEARLISDVGLDDVSAVPAELAFWMRCPDFTDTSLSRPVLAYVSDWPVIGTLLKAVPGLSQQDAHIRLQTGVISHSIWFHQPFDVSQWLRLEIRGQRLAGGRGFGTGAVYTQAGALVASFAQESVIRSFA
jgi:acyl-CoA thioesterase II